MPALSSPAANGYLATLCLHQQPMAAIAVLLGGCKRVARQMWALVLPVIFKFRPKVVLGRARLPVDLTQEPLVWAVLKGQQATLRL